MQTAKLRYRKFHYDACPLRFIDALAVRYYDSDTDGQLDGDATYDGTHYYLQDANFNVTAVAAVVSETTTVLERYHYTPYGEVTTYDANWANSSTHSRINNPYLYTARRLDAATGIYHYRTRPYHPQLGRFLGRDWKLYGGGDVNLYNYVGNRPLGLVDPWGLAPPLRRPTKYPSEGLGVLAHTIYVTFCETDELWSQRMAAIADKKVLEGRIRNFYEMDRLQQLTLSKEDYWGWRDKQFYGNDDGPAIMPGATGVGRHYTSSHEATVAGWQQSQERNGFWVTFAMPGGYFDHAVIVAGSGAKWSIPPIQMQIEVEVTGLGSSPGPARITA